MGTTLLYVQMATQPVPGLYQFGCQMRRLEVQIPRIYRDTSKQTEQEQKE
jgi:hypothetical protein